MEWLRIGFMAISALIALNGVLNLSAPYTFRGLDLAVIWLAIGTAFYMLSQQAGGAERKRAGR